MSRSYVTFLHAGERAEGMRRTRAPALQQWSREAPAPARPGSDPCQCHNVGGSTRVGFMNLAYARRARILPLSAADPLPVPHHALLARKPFPARPDPIPPISCSHPTRSAHPAGPCHELILTRRAARRELQELGLHARGARAHAVD